MEKSLDRALNSGRKSFLRRLLFGIACCAIEMMAVGASRYDLDRFGMFFCAIPRQADLMIVAGTVVKKMAPRSCIAVEACAICGGRFYNSYSVVQGIDQIVPVDIHVPGGHLPPRGAAGRRDQAPREDQA